jgi:hypothetical protein
MNQNAHPKPSMYQSFAPRTGSGRQLQNARPACKNMLAGTTKLETGFIQRPEWSVCLYYKPLLPFRKLILWNFMEFF